MFLNICRHRESDPPAAEVIWLNRISVRGHVTFSEPTESGAVHGCFIFMFGVTGKYFCVYFVNPVIPVANTNHICLQCCHCRFQRKVPVRSICRFRCVILTLTNMSNLYGSFFTLIFAVLLVGTNFYLFLYETLTRDNTYLRCKVQLPSSDSSEITAGGLKITLERPVPLDAHQRNKNLAIANRSGVSCAHNTSRAFIGLNITP